MPTTLITFCFAFCLAALSLAASAPSARAAISEPNATIYGTVLGSDAGGTWIEARFRGETIAEAQAGTIQGVENIYVLQVPLEQPSGSQSRSTGTLWIEDEVEIFVGGSDSGQRVRIRDRGALISLDLFTESATGVADTDGDGTPDFLDNCGGVSNPLQADTNQNGVGDACEGLFFADVHRTVKTISADDGANPADQGGFGSVAYEFSLMNAEVTNLQYIAMLNSVAGSDPHGLFNPQMTADPRGGIERLGGEGSYRYRVKPNMGGKPVNFVSWLDAARFANWNVNGRPTGAQDAGTTEAGAFDLTQPQPSVNAKADPSANWSLPTEDEWHKAAYYDATESPPYWLYPTRSDTPPIFALASPDGEVENPGQEVANYGSAAVWNGVVGNVTSGASSGSSSPSGLADLGGNVSEWLANDSEEGGTRIVRGGSFLDDRFALESIAGLSRSAVRRDPSYEGADVGFRLALVPEPAAGHLAWAALGTVGTLLSLRKRRRQPQGR